MTMRQEPADSDAARPSPNPAALVAAVLLVFIAVVLVPVWLRAARFCFNNYDLGIYGQALAQLGPANWNPWLSGRQVFLFADHFDPVLVLAVPFARSLGLPWGGLLAEALFVGASVIPILWLVRRGELSPSGGVLLSALLLFNAATVSALSFPIHPTTWAVLPWMWLVLRPQWILLALIVPPLAIRFLGDAWRHHYGAVLVGGLVGFFVGWLRDRAVPKWVTASVMLALLLTGIPQWRDSFRTMALSDRFPKNCPGAPERVAAIRESVEELRHKPGPLLVGGNLLPHLAERTNVFMIGGPVPNERFSAVLVEKPPHGDPWPLDPARVEALIEHWRSLPDVRIVRDEAEVFFAEGDLRESR